MEKISGVVKSFNPQKGFGFIIDSEGIEYFFHFSELQVDGYKTIKKNKKVKFLPFVSERGKRGKEIEIVE